jgi:hypothetical protein
VPFRRRRGGASLPCAGNGELSEFSDTAAGAGQRQHRPPRRHCWSTGPATRFKRIGCAPAVSFVRRPPNRQLAELELGRIDILPGFAYSAELPPEMVFPMRGGEINTAMRIATDLSSLYVRKDDTSVSWDGEALGGARQHVGTSIGGTMEKALAKKQGWVLEAAPTPHANLRKLLASRIDVILESDSVVGPLAAGMDACASLNRRWWCCTATSRCAKASSSYTLNLPSGSGWRCAGSRGSASRSCRPANRTLLEQLEFELHRDAAVQPVLVGRNKAEVDADPPILHRRHRNQRGEPAAVAHVADNR